MTQDDNEQIAQRRAKLRAIRAAGSAYPNDFRPTAFAGDLHQAYAAGTDPDPDSAPLEVRIGGRLMTRRIMGKASFAHIQDMTGRIQIFVQRETLGGDGYDAFKRLDIGDIVGAEGVLFRTRTGELSVRVRSLRLLAKSLRPLPEKYHGIADQEMRHRLRYVDLIMSEATRETFRRRSRIVAFLRSYLDSRRFLEVETPMMQPIPGGAVARPFVTHHNALDMDLYLRIAPELYLKRLVVGGFERVYEINRSFRNEGVSTRHNPEFTMLEFYQAYADHHDLMDLTEDMLRSLARELTGSTTVRYQGQEIDLGPPFARHTVAESILARNDGLKQTDLADTAVLRRRLESLGVECDAGAGPGRLQVELFEKTVEHLLVQPTFITAFPVEVSPLSRRNDADPFVADRFELFIGGREIANGFSELNDPEDQADRFRQQAAAKEAGDLEAMHFDSDYVRALEYGLPPTAGEGVGIDRLVMLFTDSPSIRDVILFPHMRPEA